MMAAEIQDVIVPEFAESNLPVLHRQIGPTTGDRSIKQFLRKQIRVLA
jgi:hypothetical protein